MIKMGRIFREPLQDVNTPTRTCHMYSYELVYEGRGVYVYVYVYIYIYIPCMCTMYHIYLIHPSLPCCTAGVFSTSMFTSRCYAWDRTKPISLPRRGRSKWLKSQWLEWFGIPGFPHIPELVGAKEEC